MRVIKLKGMLSKDNNAELNNGTHHIHCDIYTYTEFDVHGSVHRKHIFKYNQQAAMLHNYLFLWNTPHVSGGSSAHHQELKNYIYSIFVKPLLLTTTLVVKVWQSTRCCIYSFWAPDDGWRNRLKHVGHFTEINTFCNVAFCWLYLEIRLRCTDPWTSNLYILLYITFYLTFLLPGDLFPLLYILLYVCVLC